MNRGLFLFQSVWQGLSQGSQDLLCIWRAESSGAFVLAVWLAGSPQGVVLASQPQKSLSDIRYVTSSALALTLGEKAVSLLDLIIWVQYLQEFVLSEWMLELPESEKADI